VPQSISVIGRDQLEDLGVTGLQEALRYTAGVSTDLYGSRNTADQYVIRGTKATTLINGPRSTSMRS